MSNIRKLLGRNEKQKTLQHHYYCLDNESRIN